MKEAKAKHGVAFIKKRDILLVLGLLAAAGILWLVLVLTRTQGAVARVSIGFGSNQQVVEIPLGQDGIHHIEGGQLPVQLEVEDGRIRFIHSQCPDHICENTGWLQHEGEQATCMPAEVSVKVIEE